METILKPHNQIELPCEVCRKLELTPGIRLVIEVDEYAGRIILVPMNKRLNRLRTHPVKNHLLIR
jgi:bifunctional DNA-binding transcriptional regulator/antitoxin component of YhaV-PrlF toxin-antitoxin module